MRCARWMNAVLSFAAGVLLGLICFELIPEIAHMAEETGIDLAQALAWTVGGFLTFHLLEKFVLVHHAHEGAYATHRHPSLGVFSAGALVGHSFLDGVIMGLAFQVSPGTGLAVAAAVLAHDFCDGLNTVGLMLSHGNARSKAWGMLALDAAAPFLGAASTLFFTLPPEALVYALAFFAGFLLYISASDILPEAHSQATPRKAVFFVLLTALGAVLMFFAASGHAHEHAHEVQAHLSPP